MTLGGILVDVKPIQRSLVIIFPVYNEVNGIEKFIDTLASATSILQNKVNLTLLAICNGSSDGSLEKLVELKSIYQNLKIISLTRNFGYEIAFEAGLKEHTADIYCLIDADGEDPVELINDFFNAINSGYKIAYGIRNFRYESKILFFFRKLFYRFLKIIADDPFKVDVGEFSMFTKQVRDEIIKDVNSYPFWRSSISRSGYRSIGFAHNRKKRIYGKSKFKPSSMLTFALIGILSTTTWPLRAVVFLNIITAVLFVTLSIFSVFGYINLNVINLILIGSFVLNISLIALAMYVARTYKNGRNRPNYFVDEIF